MNPNDPMFSTFMTQMLGQMRAGNPEQPPEERFASQLEQLASMGFIDRQQNIQGKRSENMISLVSQKSKILNFFQKINQSFSPFQL